ncbi:hypothetical protein PhaeoP23_03949 (plasmid) [Phaeobacter piscinae]|uniref:Uncharacterized protein n=1 Tax=Phaeobacter piscinae TaxID=1580596 RepID=A0ABN5DKV5_9RHOB|nr:hypothetical protein PhaeoP36_04027 [Phaeobacter piscinae]AUQ88623.1 hypothetical protein PhaeoP42_04028 [Phaeobacter piscinae]AUQ92622.1 hypothetical protein PhaeoP24_04064 [Phaeobacter inhibens]AUR26428.1 hypothetical protein PhaeoP23_03949 [Phaeobacter piscinae]
MKASFDMPIASLGPAFRADEEKGNLLDGGVFSIFGEQPVGRNGPFGITARTSCFQNVTGLQVTQSNCVGWAEGDFFIGHGEGHKVNKTHRQCNAFVLGKSLRFAAGPCSRLQPAGRLPPGAALPCSRCGRERRALSPRSQRPPRRNLAQGRASPPMRVTITFCGAALTHKALSPVFGVFARACFGAGSASQGRRSARTG